MNSKKSPPSSPPRKAKKTRKISYMSFMENCSSSAEVMKPPVGRKGKPRKPGKKPQGK